MGNPGPRMNRTSQQLKNTVGKTAMPNCPGCSNAALHKRCIVLVRPKPVNRGFPEAGVVKGRMIRMRQKPFRQDALPDVAALSAAQVIIDWLRLGSVSGSSRLAAKIPGATLVRRRRPARFESGRDG